MGALIGLAGAALLASGCVVRAYSTPATATVYTEGSVHTSGAVAVDSSETYTVNNYPPEPLYEEVSVSPGYGYVWIDGYWNWNGYDWAWSSGRWVRERQGYVYVAPYYDHLSGGYVYRGGYWSRRDRLPRSYVLRERRDGRPSVYLPQVRDHRARRYHDTYYRSPGYRGSVRGGGYDRRGPDVRDHRTYRQPSYDRRQPDVRDHRTPGYDRRTPDVRDHRTPTYDRRQPDVRDHRTPGAARRPPPRRPPASDHRTRDDRDRDDRDHRRGPRR
ncbi:MAG TPA: hypothetical protein VK698_06860 [Kofleriaceae bacterium]|nr:hypothetical protein [Kofleriaceae bacterium]